jgi:hypothetical protein
MFEKLKTIKKYINKDTIKTIAKEGAQIGVDIVTESGKSFISALFYKIIFIIILIGTITIAGCVGTELIVDMIQK